VIHVQSKNPINCELLCKFTLNITEATNRHTREVGGSTCHRCRWHCDGPPTCIRAYSGTWSSSPSASSGYRLCEAAPFYIGL